MGKVFRAREETKEGPPLLRDMVANRATKHGVGSFQGIQHGTDRDQSIHIEDNFVIDSSKSAEVRWKDDSDHWIG